jgi:hypothetical protein
MLWTTAAVGEDFQLPQFHGFATESFTASDDNNYLGINTTPGTFDWTEAALNADESFTDDLRVGVQVQLMKLGAFGRWSPTFDWALLPEPMYAVDWGTTNLSQHGGELHGQIHLPGRAGQIVYSAYYGSY